MRNEYGVRRRWELDEPIGVSEAARFLGLPYSTVRDRLLGAPARQVGRRRYYQPTVIRERVFGREVDHANRQ